VVLVVVDALRADHVGVIGGGNLTPNIDRLSVGGAVFTNCISQAPWTKPSFASILTSLDVHEHSITNWASILDSSIITLPEILKENGYFTTSYSWKYQFSDKYNMFRCHIDFIDERFQDGRIINQVIHGVLYPATEINRPFFALIHYWEPHAPYLRGFYIKKDGDKITEIPDLVTLPRFDQNDPDTLFKGLEGYQNDVKCADYLIGGLINWFPKNTIFIITADHGEAFYEHGWSGHGNSCYDEEIHVPLIISPVDKPCFIDGQVRSIDVAPTILSLLDIDIPITWKGVNALKVQDRTANIWCTSESCEKINGRSFAVRTNKLKVIAWDNDSIEVYSPKDEQRNLLRGEGKKAILSGNEKRVLKSLGYLQ
jgi:phosphoglycerol transferase MdoB-like AlkP superfamily enzyme